MSEKGEKMNPWKSKKHKNIYKDVNVRKLLAKYIKKHMSNDLDSGKGNEFEGKRAFEFNAKLAR